MRSRFLLRLLAILCVPSVVLICLYLTDGDIPLILHSLRLRSITTMEGKSMNLCNGSWVEKYKHFHENSLVDSAAKNSTRFLVYWCNGAGNGCGGFGNRIYGIVSLFYLAVLTNRVFLIHWGDGEQLQDLLQPNTINWTYRPSIYKNGNRHKRYWGVWKSPPGFYSSRIETEGNFHNWIANEADFDVLFTHRVESIGTIWYFAEHLQRNPRLKERWHTLGLPLSTDPYTLIGCAMEFLFKKSPYMEKQLSEAKSMLKFSHRNPVIGIHIRTDDHHWGDANPHSVRTRDVENVYDCAIRLQKTLKTKLNTDGQILWYLAADRAEIKHEWAERHPKKVITYDSLPTHLEHLPTKKTLTDVLIDIYLLSESNFLIGTRDSTFSNVVIGLGRFSSSNWVYGEYCDDLRNKTLLQRGYRNQSHLDKSDN